MSFKEVYEFFGIFGELFKFSFKLLLFVLLWVAPIGIIYFVSSYVAEILETDYRLIMAAFCFIIGMIALAYCCKIWARTDITFEQKWALMNGREMPSSVKSDHDIYKELFDQAERNLKWKKSKETAKSADYELSQDGTKYIRIK